MATVSFKSHDISETPSFSSFISLWTLSLAPLIAHIVSGVPQRVHLTHGKLSLLERLVHWNPTSILWRYFAILDRRVRARSWDKAMLATSNALFWTEGGWNGGEEMLSRTAPYLTRVPKKTHLEFSSASFLQTLVVALQGIQALYMLVEINQFAQSSFAILPMIFVPLALFGLFRVPAAFWLVEEYAFADVRDETAVSRRSSYTRPVSTRHLSSGSINSNAGDSAFWDVSELQTISSTSPELHYSAPSISDSQRPLLKRNESSTAQSGTLWRSTSQLGVIEESTPRFHSPRSWRGIAVRILYVSPTLGIVALAIIYMTMTNERDRRFSVTGISMIVSYGFFTIVTAVLFITHMVSGATRTTVIPGICHVWYKAYTCILFVMAVIMFIVASMEQVQPPCDGSGVCQGIASLQNFGLTFNASSHQHSWSMSGFLNASYVMVAGKYTGFVNGTDELGNTFNASLGSEVSQLPFAGS